MKALFMILLGAILFTYGGVKAVESSDGRKPNHVLYCGLTLLGVGVGLWGLIRNHYDHTRRR